MLLLLLLLRARLDFKCNTEFKAQIKPMPSPAN